MKYILITGAAGFVGSAVAKKYLAEGIQVVTIDNLSTGRESNIPAGCIFIKGDVSDKECLEKLNDYVFDSIIHIAGQSSGEVSFENPVYDIQTNTQSTIMLLDYARKTGCKNFVFASSMSVYGDHKHNPFVNELSETNPKSFYAVGKLASEKYMKIFSDTYGIKCTALRFFNVYGVGQNLDNLKQGMASIFLAQAINDKHILVKGSKDRFRDFVYIDDVVEAVVLSEKRNLGELFEVYNVSSQSKTTVEELLSEISDSLKGDISVEYTSGTLGDQNGIFGDNSKICSQLKWSSNYSFKVGMSKMISWATNEINHKS